MMPAPGLIGTTRELEEVILNGVGAYAPWGISLEYLGAYGAFRRLSRPSGHHGGMEFNHANQFVFHVPGKALIVKLAYQEWRGDPSWQSDRHVRSGWSVDVWMEFDRLAGVPRGFEIQSAMSFAPFQNRVNTQGYYATVQLAQNHFLLEALPVPDLLALLLGYVIDGVGNQADFVLGPLTYWLPYLGETFGSYFNSTNLAIVDAVGGTGEFWETFAGGATIAAKLRVPGIAYLFGDGEKRVEA